MTKFDYDDLVRVRIDAPCNLRPGEKAWVVGITLDKERQGSHFDQFPEGVIYLIEFENGDAIDVHECHLEFYDDLIK